jgi:hypothetical protein
MPIISVVALPPKQQISESNLVLELPARGGDDLGVALRHRRNAVRAS